MSLLQFAQWLEATAAGTMVRESIWGFPILVAVHLFGLSLSVGIIAWFDLRLMGAGMTRTRVSRMYRALIPWATTGFVIMGVSGVLLLTGFATAAYKNQYFWLKMTAIVAAGVNAVVYHTRTERTIAQWDEGPRPPLPARFAGLTSLALWMCVILLGRMMSYTMFTGG